VPSAEPGVATSDARLVEEARGGDPDAFGQLVMRYEKRLLRLIGRFVADSDLARDLAQDTFLRAYQRLGQFDAARRFGPWLFRIGVNRCIDFLRQRRRSSLPCFSDAPNGLDPEVVCSDPSRERALAQEVHWVLEQIPLAYRTVLVLRDLEGFSCSEIAAILGRRHSTIRWRLACARDRFRVLWLRRNPDHSGRLENRHVVQV
jgi:RNA polymerase sigma-70 factor (ECF subfamily)